MGKLDFLIPDYRSLITDFCAPAPLPIIQARALLGCYRISG